MFLWCGAKTVTGIPGGSNGKEFAWNAGDPGSIPVLGRSPGEGNGYSLQYSCLDNSVDRELDWWATVHGITNSQTQLSSQHFHFFSLKNCYRLTGKYWFIHSIHQTLHLWISIYSSLYKIILTEKNSIP